MAAATRPHLIHSRRNVFGCEHHKSPFVFRDGVALAAVDAESSCGSTIVESTASILPVTVSLSTGASPVTLDGQLHRCSYRPYAPRHQGLTADTCHSSCDGRV
jgi:hypothetical protein